MPQKLPPCHWLDGLPNIPKDPFLYKLKCISEGFKQYPEQFGIAEWLIFFGCFTVLGLVLYLAHKRSKQ